MKKCIVCGKSEVKAKGMCEKHYQQYRKYGYCLDNNPRTKQDLNEIIEYEDYAEIILYDKNCEEVARALIDLDDVDKVKNYKWGLTKGYVLNKTIRELHRFIMNCPDDKIVDHINHNRLDNRKSNLRICTKSQNAMNVKKRKDNTSGATGVCWNKKYNNWYAQIVVNTKCVCLGHYNTKEEAIEARKQAEIDLFGDYRNKEDEE